MSKKTENTKTPDDFAFPKAWTLFGPVGKDDPEPDFAGMNAIPNELAIAGKKLAAQKAAFADDNRLDLGALLGGKEVGKTAYLLATIEAAKELEVELGAGADWWMKWWVNGEVVCDTTPTGNGKSPPSPADHRFTARLKAGRNLIAVKVDSGSGGFALAAGGPREMRDEPECAKRWIARMVAESASARREWNEKLASSAKPMTVIKEDWETVKTRLTHWWANEFYDRAVLLVTAPKAGVLPAAPWPRGGVTPEVIWTNVEYNIWRTEEGVRTTYFGGDSVPAMGPGGGWSVGHALLFGCEPHFAPSTVWTDPLPAGADGYPHIRFDREGRWWKWLREGTRKAAQASRGRWFVWPAWGNEAGDILSLIRGDMNLLVDIAENPEWVRRAVKQVSDSLIEVFEELWQLVDASVTGFEGSMAGSIWSPGRAKEFSCDISCNLSPKQFEELFLPPIIETMRTVDHRYYHLDGTVALHHLDVLLSVPEIHAIQWVPGSGHEAILQWVPLIRRIQQAGKAVQVFCGAQEVAPLLNEVSARGLCICTGCGSEAEARDIERQVAKLSRER